MEIETSRSCLSLLCRVWFALFVCISGVDVIGCVFRVKRTEFDKNCNRPDKYRLTGVDILLKEFQTLKQTV